MVKSTKGSASRFRTHQPCSKLPLIIYTANHIGWTNQRKHYSNLERNSHTKRPPPHLEHLMSNPHMQRKHCWCCWLQHWSERRWWRHLYVSTWRCNGWHVSLPVRGHTWRCNGYKVVMCHYLYVGTRDGARDTRFSCVTTCTRARDDANFANKLAQSTTESWSCIRKVEAVICRHA